MHSVCIYSMPVHPFCLNEKCGKTTTIYMGTLERIYSNIPKRFQVVARLYLELFPVMNISLFLKIFHKERQFRY